MRFRVTFQFRGTASGFPLSEEIYAESERAAQELAQRLAMRYGYRVLRLERVEDPSHLVAQPAGVGLGDVVPLTPTIGICCYNEEANISTLLENLLAKQNLPAEAEILVMCSGSTDRTPSIVQSFVQRDKRVKLLTEPVRNGKAHALNLILDNYRGDCLVHLDADQIPSDGAIPLLVEHLNHPKIGAVAGRQIPLDGGKFVSKLAHVLYSVHDTTQRYYARRGYLQHLGGVLFAIRRGVCDRVPEDIVNDDAYMAVECSRKGLRMVYEERASGYLNPPASVPEFVAQRRRIVYGHLRVRKETGFPPAVLEAGRLRDQLTIVLRWSRMDVRSLPYLLALIMLEVGVNLVARVDLRRNSKAHVVWRIAESTKSSVRPIAPAS